MKGPECTCSIYCTLRTFSDLFGGDSDNDLQHTVGGGVRYLIARRLGLQAGIDVAKGPEDTVFYLTVGSAWR